MVLEVALIDVLPGREEEFAAAYRQGRRWLLHKGTMHLMADPLYNLTFEFDSLTDHHFTETPQELTSTPRAPTDMEQRPYAAAEASMSRSACLRSTPQA